MKINLFQKTFAYTFGMMLMITILAHALIFLIAPSQNVLITSTLISNVGTTTFSEVDMSQLITQTILKTFPISIACCVVISLFFSLLFSKGITMPVLSIMKSVHQMSKLDVSAKATVTATDEIGDLATDINTLYQSLLLTIRNLELEKEKVHLAEKEKIDFLRTASHELKTPVTELNATLENMILGIGEYCDYEIYLPRCKEITEQLGEMIRDILNTSRLQVQSNSEPATMLSMEEILLDLCEPYQLIAKTKKIQFEMDILDDISVYLPENQLKKAISNILSNAVNYTEAGRKISVTLDGKKLSIHNECDALSPEQLEHIFEPFYRPDLARNRETGGNGLGLYIVQTILDKLHLKYRFVPMKKAKGMDFTIYF
jgi:two-component system sensor kinase Ihk